MKTKKNNESSILELNEQNKIPLKEPTDSPLKKNRKLRATIFVAFVLLFATFVAYPYQGALAHDSGSHEFCFDQTLNAGDWLADALFPVFEALAKLLPGGGEAFAIAAKIVLSIVIIAGGIALSTLCAPQVAPPPKAYRVYLPCNYPGLPGTELADLKGFRVYPDTEETKVGDELKSFQSFNPFLHFGRPWNFTDDDREVDKSPQDARFFTFPVIGSFRDSIYTESSGGTRLGFTTWYSAESTLLWIDYQLGTIISLIFGILPGPKPDAKWFIKIGAVLLEVLVGLVFVALLAIFANYKTNIAKVDPTGGTIAHPVWRFFNIKRNFDSSSVLTPEQVKLLNEPDFKLYPLGQNEIQYKGSSQVAPGGGQFITDAYPAKFYFNVIDPMPPYVGFGNHNVTIVEANAHWGFVVEPKEWKKMGFNEFVKWDNCNLEPKVEYADDRFIPMALITENQEKFRQAQNVYDLEFEKSHNTAVARHAYLNNVTLSEEDKNEFNVEWKATDHPEGYDVYEGAMDPLRLPAEDGSASPLDLGDEDFLYSDEDITQLIETHYQAYNDFSKIVNKDHLKGAGIKTENKLEQGVVKLIEESFEGFDDFSGKHTIKNVNFPSSCPTFHGGVDDRIVQDGITCLAGLGGSIGISSLQKPLGKATQINKVVGWTQVGAKLDDDIKKIGDEIADLKRTSFVGEDALGDLDKKITKRQADLDDLVKQKGELQDAVGGAGVQAGLKLLSVGIAAVTTFVNPPKDEPPETVTMDGLESFWNQTVIVIDTTPPDVLV
ncbi:MAG: hypothetical protein OEQ12_07565, partial [Nitrosopumilus sp.]|nr:hypothetical protein [Nitrosopumilus sp.]